MCVCVYIFVGKCGQGTITTRCTRLSPRGGVLGKGSPGGAQGKTATEFGEQIDSFVKALRRRLLLLLLYDARAMCNNVFRNRHTS